MAAIWNTVVTRCLPRKQVQTEITMSTGEFFQGQQLGEKDESSPPPSNSKTNVLFGTMEKIWVLHTACQEATSTALSRQEAGMTSGYFRLRSIFLRRT